MIPFGIFLILFILDHSFNGLFMNRLPHHAMLSRNFKHLISASVFLILVACGEHGGGKNSQSIVRVNDDEITVHQVNFQMQRMQVNEKNKDAIAKQVISGLVDRQLLVQEALKTEMDRNPLVMQALEESKMQILAKAYLENKVANVNKPTDAEISDYRAKHPELFENRKLYAIEELTFNMDETLSGELDKLSDVAKTMEEVTTWLDGKQIKYGRNKVVRAAESIPQGLVTKISQLNNGEMLFVRGPNGYSVARLLETKLQPIGVDESKQIITRLILNDRQKVAASAEMERLRKQGKVVYLDKKYEMKQQVSGSVKSPTPEITTEKSTISSTESQSIAPEGAQVKDATKTEQDKNINASVEKGLSGL